MIGTTELRAGAGALKLEEKDFIGIEIDSDKFSGIAQVTKL